MVWKFPFGKKPKQRSQAAANDAVRDVLARHGDDGSGVRHVVHYAYPLRDAEPAGRSAMVDDLAAMGFGVQDAATRAGLVLEHYRSVDGDSFNDLTNRLNAWFTARDWEYDGWECELRTGESH